MSIATNKEVKDLDALIAKLSTIRKTQGNLPFITSVYQEGKTEFCSHYDERHVDQIVVTGRGIDKHVALFV